MKKFILSFSILFGLAFSSLQAQVYIIEEPGVESMMERYKSLNKANPLVTAWKIQIIATNDRRKMERTISKFAYLYPNIEYEWKHASPYYQVYIGAYEKKEDFMDFLLELKKEFPSAIPVIERISKTKLL